jgi:hypothetical protein
VTLPLSYSRLKQQGSEISGQGSVPILNRARFLDALADPCSLFPVPCFYTSGADDQD